MVGCSWSCVVLLLPLWLIVSGVRESRGLETLFCVTCELVVSGSVASDILLLSEEPFGSSGTTTSLCSGDIGAGGSRHYLYVCVCQCFSICYPNSSQLTVVNGSLIRIIR